MLFKQTDRNIRSTGKLSYMDSTVENSINLLDRISDAFISVDAQWNLRYVNRRAGELAGKDPGSMLGRNIWEVFPEATGTVFYQYFINAMQSQQYLYTQDYYKPLDLWLEVKIYPSADGLTAFFSDISEKRKAEQKLVNANRLYNFISQVNQLIVREKEATALFREVCQIAIHTGKFRMAWIGLVDEHTRRVVPVIHAGEAEEYLSRIAPISIDPALPEGRGPTGTAIREGKYIVCNDIERDPQMAPWKEAAVGAGYHASISLPVKTSGKVIGAFSLYASSINYFNPEEIALLEGTTNDIAYALDNILREESRRKTLQELTASEQKHRLIFENSLDGILLSRPDGGVVSANPAACAIFGMTEAEICSGGRAALVDPAEKNLPEILKERSQFGKARGILLMRRKNGESFPAEIASAVFQDTDGSEKTSMIIRDITERKKAESEILEINNQLRLLSDHLQKIREEERTYIAREIHDELGQQLTVMSMDVSWLEKNIQSENGKITQRITELKNMLAQTVKTVRRISSELRPSILDDMGLAAAIHWQLEEFGKRSGLQTKMIDRLPPVHISEEVKTGLFRIMQESLTNVGRYAQAKQVEILLQENAGELELVISDDGMGFDSAAIHSQKTLGLLGMRERAAMIGGIFAISSEKGKGTTVTVRVPSGAAILPPASG